MAPPENDQSKVFEKFSYEKTKKAFEELQWKYIKRHRAALANGTLQLWSCEKVNAYIEFILDYNAKTKDKDVVPPEEVTKYDAVQSDESPDKFNLVLKKRKYLGRHVRVIPLEECFDVLVEEHRLFGHRGRCKKIYIKVLRKYVIDKVWISLLLKVCNMCKSVKNHKLLLPLQTYYKCYQIFICKNLVLESNSPFSCILIVVDKTTHFVHLRPIADCIMGPVVTELLMIFADFGVPKTIETNDMKFFRNVVLLMSKFAPEMNATVLTYLTEPNVPTWTKVVKSHLEEWMDITGSTNWSYGCSVVQWQMNNTIGRYNNTPYKDVFHVEPVKEILA